ncbi:hypothetical protein [Kribbella voronezhensis]|uniref:hypothetical protein n=1 Tax=Kribbella voronezhensis TaxID=2512212 RepID=UPI001EDD3109|nr:hypothetical protein [Kribbella voronezhensis]
MSDILETGPHLSKYSLNPTVCRGILTRTARRRRNLPPELRAALEQTAATATTEAAA